MFYNGIQSFVVASKETSGVIIISVLRTPGTFCTWILQLPKSWFASWIQRFISIFGGNHVVLNVALSKGHITFPFSSASRFFPFIAMGRWSAPRKLPNYVLYVVLTLVDDVCRRSLLEDGSRHRIEVLMQPTLRICFRRFDSKTISRKSTRYNTQYRVILSTLFIISTLCSLFSQLWQLLRSQVCLFVAFVAFDLILISSLVTMEFHHPWSLTMAFTVRLAQHRSFEATTRLSTDRIHDWIHDGSNSWSNPWSNPCWNPWSNPWWSNSW